MTGLDPADILADVAREQAEEKPPPPEPPTVDTVHPYTTVYCDGSSTGGWGPWGWGWCVLDGPNAGREECGGGGWGTNQIAEVTAIHRAMLALPGLLLVVSDSEYAIKSLTEWSVKWRETGWRKVKNREVIEPAVETFLDRRGEVRMQWVKGHNGLPGNERADVLAGQGRDAVPFADWGPKHDPVAYAAYITPGGRTSNGKAARR